MNLFENLILGAQVIDDRLLLAVDPAGEDDDEKVPGLHDEVHWVTPMGEMR